MRGPLKKDVKNMGKNEIEIGGKIVEESPKEWSLDDLQRIDIEQADIAPLMSTLLGVEFPVNSVGVLPVKFLDVSENKKAEILYFNALQMWNQFHRGDQIHEERKFFYKKYSKMEEMKQLKEELEKTISTKKKDEKNFAEILPKIKKLFNFCFSGLRYLQTYDRLMLFFITCSSYVLWIVYLSIWVRKNFIFFSEKKNNFHDEKKKNNNFFLMIDFFFLFCFFFFSLFFYLEKSPITYYLYILFPFYLSREIVHEKREVEKIVLNIISSLKNKEQLLILCMTPLILEIIVFGYFKREIFFFCFIFIALWGFFCDIKNINVKIIWILSTLSTSVFPLFPVNHGDSLFLVILGGFLVFFSTVFFIYKMDKKKFSFSEKISLKFFLPLLLCFLCILSVYFSTASLQQKKGLPFINQIMNWTLLFSFFFFLFFKKENQTQTLLNVFVSLSSVYLLFCVSYESLFFLSFSIMLFSWILIEKEVRNVQKNNKLSIHEFRSGIFYFSFIKNKN